MIQSRHSSPAVTRWIVCEPANLERIFDAFHTVKPNGLGMGLSICRAISEAHEGKLWASCKARPHMTFQLTI